MFKSLLGIPCPTCGSGRALEAFAHANFGKAAVMNPLFFLLMLVAAAAFFLSASGVVLKIPQPVVQFSARGGNLLRLIVIFVFLINWAFLIIAHR